MPKTRVAVIGAGAAGLCSARHLAADPDHFEFVVFEQSGEIGGTWVYTEQTDSDSYGVRIHSSMYKNLKTNVPKEIMPFPDFPFHHTDSSFVHHTDVLKYLKDYTQHFDLYKYIRLRTQVKKVSPKCSPGGVQWLVIVHDVENQREEELTFDAVVVCNGHFTTPYKPEIDGMDQFKGTVMHSKDYRDPEIMRGLRVVILGASSSGVDIAMEVSEAAEKVYLCHKNPEPLTCKLPANVTQLPVVKSASKEGFTISDGSSVEADAFIYCTGYLFSFPFMTPECKVHVEGHRVMPLYKHLIHTELPTLCFIGLPSQILPFPLFHYQIQYFMKTLEGSITLPSKQEMDEETERDLQKRLAMAMPPHDAHKMGSLQWDYFGELATSMGMDSLPPVVRMLYDHVVDQRKKNLMNYKKESYQVLDHGNFERKQVGP